MRAAQPALHQIAAGCREHHARGLGGDGGLEMQEVRQARLDELRLGQRRGHAEDGLAGEKDRSLRHRIDIAGEAEGGEIVHESAREEAALVEPGAGILIEAKRLEEGQDLLEARGDQEAAIARELADEELEDRGAGHPVRRARLERRQVAEIAQQGISRDIGASLPGGGRRRLDPGQPGILVNRGSWSTGDPGQSGASGRSPPGGLPGRIAWAVALASSGGAAMEGAAKEGARGDGGASQIDDRFEIVAACGCADPQNVIAGAPEIAHFSVRPLDRGREPAQRDGSLTDARRSQGEWMALRLPGPHGDRFLFVTIAGAWRQCSPPRAAASSRGERGPVF